LKLASFVGATSCGGLVFVDESAEEVEAVHGSGRTRRVERGRVTAVGRLEVERTVGPVLVVVPAVDAEHVLEMPPAEDEETVEAVGADSSHPAFGVGVGVGRLDGRPDHVEALGSEDAIEDIGRLASTVCVVATERAQAENTYGTAYVTWAPS